ncbi:MAG: hypothetical protein R3194_02520, partial [Limnobacter sp.]|nr:hypothetical protein [Limnobacter sp.]
MFLNALSLPHYDCYGGKCPMRFTKLFSVIGVCSVVVSLGAYSLKGNQNDNSTLALNQSQSDLSGEQPSLNNTSIIDNVFEGNKAQLLNQKLGATQIAANDQSREVSQRQDMSNLVPPADQKPNIQLPERANGQKAIDLLRETGQFEAFANYYGMTAEQLESQFLLDSTLNVTPDAHLMYVETMQSTLEYVVSDAKDEKTSPLNTNIPLDQTFKLESKPGSLRTLYLEFDGEYFKDS